MYDDRMFTDTYDLYRPTISRSDDAWEKLSRPSTATSTGNPCIFFNEQGSFVDEGRGAELPYDAIMEIPGSADLRPTENQQTPDYVLVNGNYFLVLVVSQGSGKNTRGEILYQRAFLTEAKGST